MRKMFYVDMHCHPSIKPYSWYITDRNNPWDCRNIKTSLWYNDPPQETDKEINKHVGLTKFTQSDFRTLTKGDVKIVSACLSPIERGLFTPKGLCKKFGLRLLRFGLEINTEFIRLVRRRNRDYFEELKEEYKYYKTEEGKQHNRTFPTQFELIRDNFRAIEPLLRDVHTDKIYVFLSIEGCHAFNNGGLENSLKAEDEIEDENVARENKQKVRDNIKEVKGWDCRPLYASLAHHINNDLCGHAKSLPPPLDRLVDQTDRMGKGFSIMGRVVLHELLDNTNDDRIHIDIKHMSAQSRDEYYKILDDDYQNDPIPPVLVSHGAVNGRESIVERNQEEANNGGEVECNDEDGDRFQNEDKLKFNNEDVNFFDDEIITIQKSKGFLGIQLDERRLCSAEQRKCEKKKNRNRGEQLHYQAGLVWKQIRYIAEVLDEKEKYGWGTAAIGSDYDGAVDPPNGYWTSDDFGILQENLIHHAVEYFTNHSDRLGLAENKPESPEQASEKAQEVIDLFMRGNAERFLRNFLW